MDISHESNVQYLGFGTGTFGRSPLHVLESIDCSWFSAWRTSNGDRTVTDQVTYGWSPASQLVVILPGLRPEEHSLFSDSLDI